MTARKLRLYLDTSVISMIDTPPESERGRITREFFQIAQEKSDEIELLLSPVTLEELQDSPEEKLSVFSKFLDATPHIELPKNQEAENLAWTYIFENVLSDKHIDDLTHVAYAVASRCDYIISWNMKHMVNPRTVARVNEVNTLNNFPRIFIAAPSFFTGEWRNAND